MRSKIIALGIVLVLLASGIGSVSAFSNSGDGDWKYYKEITVKENSGETLTNFQVLVELKPANFPANANSDGSDLRFEDANSKELNYWIEEWYYPNNAKIWVKVPSISASGETKIKMYYGNPSASAVSDGDKVFEFFDDFEGGDISDWDISVVSSSHSIVDESGNLYQQHKSSKAGPTSCGCNCYRDHKIDMKKRLNLPVNTYVVELYGRETACWGYGLCLYIDSTKYIFEPQQNFCYNNADTRQWRWLHSDPLTIPIGMFYLERHDQTSAGFEEIDVIRIRKYTSPEPTLTLSAEHRITTPTPIVPTPPFPKQSPIISVEKVASSSDVAYLELIYNPRLQIYYGYEVQLSNPNLEVSVLEDHNISYIAPIKVKGQDVAGKLIIWAGTATIDMALGVPVASFAKAIYDTFNIDGSTTNVKKVKLNNFLSDEIIPGGYKEFFVSSNKDIFIVQIISKVPTKDWKISYQATVDYKYLSDLSYQGTRKEPPKLSGTFLQSGKITINKEGIDHEWSFTNGNELIPEIPTEKRATSDVPVPEGDEVTPTTGFEVGFAIAGLLAVVYVLER